ncbi:hypothetical protein EAO75_37385 [Streptomyces sp. uw30]|uniref:DUF6585 family protein n=1 Tax=Streptomyces sp. uw30 TaxID=1828179 RepID=UPI00130BFCF2|nr:DUF6585 family protein [Streptomyces sp. uw30]TXS40611.1 hypothetical protein EAO75_37385 [Streptomyces sp. uw30]
MGDGTHRDHPDAGTHQDRPDQGTHQDHPDDGTHRDRLGDRTHQDHLDDAPHQDRPDQGTRQDRVGDGTHRDRVHERADALLLARVSEAAGLARLGRRRATYRAPTHRTSTHRTSAHRAPTHRASAHSASAHPPSTHRASALQPQRAEPGRQWAALAGLRRLLRVDCGSGSEGVGARLDLYEHGLTVTVDGRIHVVRYDTTVVRRRRVLSPQGLTRAHVLVGVDGERIVLRCGDFGDPQEWGPEIHRSVADAQVPRALVALTRGERLVFGPVWITRAELGSRGTTLRWAQVQRIEVLKGSVAVRTAGRWQVWGSVTSGIPNLCVLRALVQHLTAAERDDD